MSTKRHKRLGGFCSVCAFLWLSCLPLTAQDRPGSSSSTPPCSTEIRFTNPKPSVSTDEMINVNLFSSVSQPSSSCLPAEIRLTASFYDAHENLICSGVIENVVTQTVNVQSSNLEIRPFNSLEFVRWRNGPRPTAVRPKRLFCMNLDGLAEIPVGDLERAAALRLHATVLAKSGGVSTAEYRANFIARPN